MTLKKEVKQLMERAKKQGFIVELSSGGHWHVKSPNGVSQRYFASTPSDPRGIDNIRSSLRGMGMDAPSSDKLKENGSRGKSDEEVDKTESDKIPCRWRDCNIELDNATVARAHEAISHYVEGRHLPLREQILYVLGAYKEPVSLNVINYLVDAESSISPIITRLLKNNEVERVERGVYIIAGLTEIIEEGEEDSEEGECIESEVSQKDESVEDEEFEQPDLTCNVEGCYLVGSPFSNGNVVEFLCGKHLVEYENKQFGVGTVAEVVAFGEERVIFKDDQGGFWLAEKL